ncbi:MAG: nitrogen fixation protein NifH [Candidatus Bathyarchaeota archaeon]|nr:nitrogen fixation protein NifH [Candidatus Bathyarchaeota archaeon]
MDLTKWLLESRDPSVRYWALRDLEGKELGDAEVSVAQDRIMESSWVRTILAAQKPGGWWVNEQDMYLPKYTATTHSLLILAELGAKRTPAIERGVEHIFKFQRNSGHFLINLPATEKGKASSVKDGCCIDGNILQYLIHFGYLDDPRTQLLHDFIISYHDNENAGWRCRSYPINPAAVYPKNCYMGAVKMLRALSMIPPQERRGEIKAIIDREVENILENGVYSYLRNPDGTRKDKAGWKRFGFPLFYQSDALEVLFTLTRLGCHDDRMQPEVDLVLGARQPDGGWLLENTFNGKMWVNIEEKGRPSKWISLRALRTLKRLGYAD